MGWLTRVWYLLLLILIITLVFYENVGYELNRAERAGVETEGQLFGTIVNISKDNFYLDEGSSNLRIESLNMLQIRKARYGETVVHVIYKKNGVIEGIDYHNYDYNHLLYLLSLIAFVIFLAIFFKEWRLTLRGFENA